MRRGAFWPIASLMFALWAGGMQPVVADQRDDRLDGLFERLQETSDPADAARLQQRIWEIWVEAEDPTSYRLMRRGITAMSSGDHEAALNLFDELVQQAPDFAEAWNKRATVHYLLGRFDESVKDIQQTLELEPRHFGALSGLALIYEAVDEPEAAIRSLEAALEINPHLHGTKARIDDLRRTSRGTRA